MNTWEIEHAYGPRVHILGNLFIDTALARLSSPKAKLHDVLVNLRTVYETLLVVSSDELPSVKAELPTRMAVSHPAEAVYRGPIFDPNAQVVIVDVIRAGIIPSQICFEKLVSVFPEERVRLDHLTMARMTDATGHVTGTDLSGSKIGGKVEGSTLLIPDPMGATGSTILRAIDHYTESYGKPAKVVVLPMIATPEYLRSVLDCFENLVVYTGRLDRGLSPADVLETVPGTHWEEERGLNDKCYIVPGAGGMGEILNNSWC